MSQTQKYILILSMQLFRKSTVSKQWFSTKEQLIYNEQFWSEEDKHLP